MTCYGFEDHICDATACPEGYVKGCNPDINAYGGAFGRAHGRSHARTVARTDPRADAGSDKSAERCAERCADSRADKEERMLCSGADALADAANTQPDGVADRDRRLIPP